MADQRFIAASRIIARRKEFLGILVHSGTYHTFLCSHNNQLTGFRHKTNNLRPMARQACD